MLSEAGLRLGAQLAQLAIEIDLEAQPESGRAQLEILEIAAELRAPDQADSASGAARKSPAPALLATPDTSHSLAEKHQPSARGASQETQVRLAVGSREARRALRP